jgi:quercetin dioxygenase-like cupin family protein
VSRIRHKASVAGEARIRAHTATFVEEYTGPTHWHDRDQLTYAASGAIEVTADDARWLLPTGHALWVPTGARHRERFFASTSACILLFPPRSVRQLPRECALVAT